MNPSFLERQSENPLVISVLIFSSISLPLTLFFSGDYPGFYYIGDVYIAIGMIFATYYLFLKIKDSKQLLKTTFFLSILGSIITALLISLLMFLLILASGRNISIIIFFLDEVRIAIIIALFLGFFTIGILKLLSKIL